MKHTEIYLKKTTAILNIITGKVLKSELKSFFKGPPWRQTTISVNWQLLLGPFPSSVRVDHYFFDLNIR